MLFLFASAVFSVCFEPRGWPEVYVYVYVWCVCDPIGNTCSASLSAGPGATKLQQPPLCWAAGHVPNRWALLCQKVSNLSPKQLRNAAQEY